MNNYVHICSKIKCPCGAEYCVFDYNGCPQCGRGKIEVITTSTTNIYKGKAGTDK